MASIYLRIQIILPFLCHQFSQVLVCLKAFQTVAYLPSPLFNFTPKRSSHAPFEHSSEVKYDRFLQFGKGFFVLSKKKKAQVNETVTLIQVAEFLRHLDCSQLKHCSYIFLEKTSQQRLLLCK